MPTPSYNVIMELPEQTVVTEYVPEANRSDAYQSEAALEKAFIAQLGAQGYDYLPIHGGDDLVANLRTQLEKLNGIVFSDDEWRRFFRECIAVENEGIVDKTRRIQEEYVQVLKRDDGTSKNITLLDHRNIHNNSLQVINQYAETGGSYDNRYDVTVLVNGLPLVHIELKRRGVPLKEAFNQIERYQRDSFWAGCGLYEYVQIFVISNGTHTKYYSNTTRFSSIQQRANARKKGARTSNSFEFTSFWADEKNHAITDLVDFTRTFFSRHTLLAILTRYCVFTSEELLLVMRPYQIAATEKLLNRVEVADNYKWRGSLRGGGYIWHTTGSGKTLTSFKSAQLATSRLGVEKVLFVVDRKDLDYQTMKEYDRFEKGAANGNRNTAILQRQLEDRDANGNPHEYRIIVTTIQKLDVFLTKNADHPIYHRHVVLIFDECHRSHFGDMHSRIVRRFDNYNIFGFTGTPIFAVNAGTGGDPRLRTTEQAFGDRLHTYTIIDAINDGNVLPFRIDYVNTLHHKDGRKDYDVEGIDTEEALMAPERISNVVAYILEHFDQKTMRSGGFYSFNRLLNVAEVAANQKTEELRAKQRLNGFNAILATASVPAAIRYYREFQRQMAAKPSQRLKVAMIFSYAPNEEEDGGVLAEENSDDTSMLDASSRDALEAAIADYNAAFGTAYDTSAAKFPNYYKDLSLRMKNREVDLLIVVNMFLTGFDATTLNTLWVDKNLRMHGLLQAFSRTNRILNSVKSFGNIVCFRNLQKATEEAIALFGDKNASGIVLLRSFRDYYDGYTDDNGVYQKGYAERIKELLEKFPPDTEIVGEERKREFVRLFGQLLRLRNILTSFDEFEGMQLLSEYDYQNYTGRYNDLYLELRGHQGGKENINDDLVFEMELVRRDEVNIDYILMLVEKYHDNHGKDKEIRASIDRAVGSSLALRSKRELIDGFIATVNVAAGDTRDAWRSYVRERLEADTEALIAEEHLAPAATRELLANAFREGELRGTGTGIDAIMPPMSRFGSTNRAAKKKMVVEKLKAFFNRFFGLVEE